MVGPALCHLRERRMRAVQRCQVRPADLVQRGCIPAMQYTELDTRICQEASPVEWCAPHYASFSTLRHMCAEARMRTIHARDDPAGRLIYRVSLPHMPFNCLLADLVGGKRRGAGVRCRTSRRPRRPRRQAGAARTRRRRAPHGPAHGGHQRCGVQHGAQNVGHMDGRHQARPAHAALNPNPLAKRSRFAPFL